MKLVEEWRTLHKRWSVWAAALGISLPDILQVVADHTDLLPWFNEGYKSGIRLACLVAIPALQAIKQANLPAPVRDAPPIAAAPAPDAGVAP